MKSWLIGPLMAALLIWGCGGGSKGASGVGSVTGIIFDQNGSPVRDASVWYDGSGGNTARDTVSNSTGSYQLSNMPAEADGYDVLVQASATIDGRECTGQNIVRIYDGERTKNLNIGVFPKSLQASLYGSVRDDSGYRISGARVFVRPHDTTIPSSAYGITNQDGDYEVNGLLAGIAYDVVVNAYGYSSDFSNSIYFTANSSKHIDYVMGNPGYTVKTPTDLIATAWTSPYESSRDAQQTAAIRGIKKLIKPNSKVVATTRDAANGYPIEVDLEWNETVTDSLLGYGIYRGTSASTLSAVEFLRDPLAVFFADADTRLIEGSNYTYAVSALNTTYDGNGGGESNLSNTYSVKPLGALTLGPVFYSPLQITWNAATGAEEYKVYIFGSYPTASPDVLVQSDWTTSTAYTYSGSSLVSGRTYYFMVVARANGGDEYSVSRVSSFAL